MLALSCLCASLWLTIAVSVLLVCSLQESWPELSCVLSRLSWLALRGKASMEVLDCLLKTSRPALPCLSNTWKKQSSRVMPSQCTEA